MRRVFKLALGISLLLLTCSFVHAQQSDDKNITKVVEDFWTTLGNYDFAGLKQVFDWPVSIVESSNTNTKNPWVLTSAKDLDNEFAKQPRSGHSEFYGTKLSDFKVQMQTPNLALVTYIATLPSSTAAPKESTFNAIAVLRKTGDGWKIIFMSVPN
ncbi:MAG TPA: nuclear transport factor 2 family protein [Pyrinomonadaceae bacterium]